MNEVYVDLVGGGLLLSFFLFLRKIKSGNIGIIQDCSHSL